jgi:hypothetical protein
MTMQRAAYPHAELSIASTRLFDEFFAAKASERLVITVDTGSDQALARTLFDAALARGLQADIILSAQLPFQGRLADPYISPALAAAVLHCDIWVDLTFPYLAGSDPHDAAMKTGRVRGLLGGDIRSANFSRLFGCSDIGALRELRLALQRFIADNVGRRCRVTTPLGTDVTFTLGKNSDPFKEPHRDSGNYTPPGSVVLPPEPDTVKGVIVVEAMLHEYYARCRKPMRFELDGKITDIKGDDSDVRVASRALRRAAGNDYGSVIHFTHGFHPFARSTGESFLEDIRVVGANAIGFGVPWWLPGGGENHPDAVAMNHSVEVDGKPIIEGGQIVGPSELVEADLKVSKPA